MKTKRILRFYFTAESLERAFQNLIEINAYNCGSDAFASAEKICSVIGDKMQLERLWAYLDGVIKEMTEKDRCALLKYSSRFGVAESDRKECNRAVIKFTRRAWRIGAFAEDLAVLKKYYSLLRFEVPLSAG